VSLTLGTAAQLAANRQTAAAITLKSWLPFIDFAQMLAKYRKTNEKRGLAAGMLLAENAATPLKVPKRSCHVRRPQAPSGYARFGARA
jgi:hypothetical protein